VKGTEGKGGEAFTHALMGVPGEFYARNITPTALADGTGEEFARAITTGVNKHGALQESGNAPRNVSCLRRSGATTR
jgi:hypothetical protein